jgi:mannose-6-phosphate isomerase
MVWGGRRLGSVLNKSLEKDEPYGESWEISDHALHRSVVANGPRAGQTLRQLMEEERALLLGPAAESYTVFPWLVKFLDACDWLSVQVHPNEQAVRRLWPGEGGKTEAWFVLDAAPGSLIYAGLLPGTDEARLRASLKAGTVARCLHGFTPRPGDCLFLPAGTVHAVGGGVLLTEVQQTSDATFRLFDWNRHDAQGRSRPLHVEEALACIDWKSGPVKPIPSVGFGRPSSSAPVAQPTRQTLVDCPYFILEYMSARETVSCGGEGSLQVLITVRGQGRWTGKGGVEKLRLGEAWVLPAALPRGQVRPEPELGLLLCTLPS